MAASSATRSRSEARPRLWAGIGSLNGLMAVACGAFGAHVLEGRLERDALEVFELAARYQMYHALAMLGCAWAMERSRGRAASAAPVLFLAGIVVFSGSLYGLSLTGWRWLGAVTPIGGLSLLCGWLALAVACLSRRGTNSSEAA